MLNDLVGKSEMYMKETDKKGEIAQERNGIDQINKAKSLLQKECLGKNSENPSPKLAEVVDKRLHNILYAWANGNVDQINPEDLPHIANLLSQKVRPAQVRRYEKNPLALRGQQRFLKAEAYHHACEKIAEEVYRSLGEEQRKLVDLKV